MKEHSYSIDLLRGIAAFGIVACHLNLLPMTDAAWNLRWFSDMFVGLFAALSGYLMSKSEIRAWLPYAQKRCVRILPTYAVWTVVFILFGLIFDYFVRHEINPKWSSDGFVFSVIFQGGAAVQLWFLISLFYGQLLLGLLAIWFPNAKSWLWVIVGLVLLAISISLGWGFYGFYMLRLFAFLFVGYGVGKAKWVEGKQGAGLSMLALIAAVLVHFFVRSAIPAFARDMIVAIPLLVLAVKCSLPVRMVPIAKILGATSMGVFLIHPIIAAGFGIPIHRFFASPTGILPFALDWVAVWVASFIATLILMRIPIVNRFVK